MPTTNVNPTNDTLYSGAHFKVRTTLRDGDDSHVSSAEDSLTLYIWVRGASSLTATISGGGGGITEDATNERYEYEYLLPSVTTPTVYDFEWLYDGSSDGVERGYFTVYPTDRPAS